MRSRDGAEQPVRAIRRKTRKQYTAEEKIRIVVSGLRGEESISVRIPSHFISVNINPSIKIFTYRRLSD